MSSNDTGTATSGEAEAPIVHLLSFDVEEYFQAEVAAAHVGRDRWESTPSRLDEPVERILGLLDAHGAVATFFILGWVGRRHPELVRRIAGAGHEIASHGVAHQMITRLTPEEFRRDLAESRAILEDLSGKAVLGYRAPTFSVMHKTAWALDVLAESGFRYDSSVFPVRHDRYGVPDAPRRVHKAVGPGGGSILEIPPLTLRAFGANWPVGGGGYLRLFPIRMVAAGLRTAEKDGQAGMVYLHPWEFDPGQPRMPLGRLSNWRHRVNLHRTSLKLDWLLRRFRFASVASSLDRLESAATLSFRYGNQQ